MGPAPVRTGIDGFYTDGWWYDGRYGHWRYVRECGIGYTSTDIRNATHIFNHITPYDTYTTVPSAVHFMRGTYHHRQNCSYNSHATLCIARTKGSHDNYKSTSHRCQTEENRQDAENEDVEQFTS